MSKTTVAAPANIAFVKYWGARDLEHALPYHPSISMTLERCVTICTAEVIEAEKDEIWLAEPDGGFRPPEPEFARRAREHLDRIRDWAGSPLRRPASPP
jgi:diphosphomevalonate decarboxylase